jgi:hypothetical protein
MSVENVRGGSSADSLGSDPSGVATVNAGEARNGTSRETAALDPAYRRQANAA